MRLLKHIITGLLLSLLPVGTAAGIRTVNIIHTADIHGHLSPAAVERLGGIISSAISDGGGRETSLLIDCGDLIQGSSAAAAGQGRPGIGFLNLLQYDVWVPGNHDFDFGFDVFQARCREFSGKILAANLGFRPRKMSVAPYAVFTRSGLRVAVIGLTFPELRRSLIPGEPEIILENFTAALDRAIPAVMGERPDIIILAAHYGLSQSYGNSENSLLTLARRYPQINLICGGHTHQINAGRKIGFNTWYVEPGRHAQGAIRVTIHYDTERRVVSDITSSFIAANQGPPFRCPPAMAEEYRRLEEYGLRRVGHAGAKISGSARGVSNPLQNLFGKALTIAAGCDLAIFSPPRGEAAFYGEISEEKLFEAAPYDDTIIVLHLSPAQLREVVEEQLRAGRESQRQLPWGFHVVADRRGNIIDLRLPPGKTRYRVAFSDYILTRGGAWFPNLQRLSVLPESRRENTTVGIRDALREYVHNASPLLPDNVKWLIIE